MAQRRSTRDRILQESLRLFNEEGEPEQSAVDIANVLEMSPGNLYYHFKGKDAIIRALFDAFEEEMRVILRGSRGQITSIEDNWVYIYILLEEIYDFRFFYRGLSALLDRYPDLAVRFRALIAEMRDAVQDILEGLECAGAIKMDPRLRPVVVDQIISALTFWLTKEAVSSDASDSSILIDKTVFETITLVVPYMGEASIETLNMLIDRYEAAQK